MPISHQYNLIFIHIPKNAGTAITNELKMLNGGHHLWTFYKSKFPKEWANYTKISIIRNPWERVISCYEYAKMEESYWHSNSGPSKAGKHFDYDLLKNLSFEECLGVLNNRPEKLRHQGWLSQSSYIVNEGRLMVDHVIDINNINKDLSKIIKTKINIPLINKSKDYDYKSYYKNDKMIDLVKKIYKEDICFFNFNF